MILHLSPPSKSQLFSANVARAKDVPDDGGRPDAILRQFFCASIRIIPSCRNFPYASERNYLGKTVGESQGFLNSWHTKLVVRMLASKMMLASCSQATKEDGPRGHSVEY